MTRTCLFIAGCTGSGTNLLRTAVSEHPAIAVGLERYNLRAFGGELTGADFEPERFFDIQKGDTWYDSLDQFPNAYEHLLAKYYTARIIGDKIPRAFTVFRHLSQVSRDTRFLVSFRDVFAVATSYENRLNRKDHWNPEWDYRGAVEDWNASIRETLNWMQYLPVLPILYDDMTVTFDAAERIGTFLEIDATPIDEFFRANAARIAPSAALITLSEQQVEYIARHADLVGYARIIQLALNPPWTSNRHASIGGGPAVVRKYIRGDARIVDYKGWQLPGCRYVFRGPEPAAPIEESVVCVGSAGTFGRFVRRPYSHLLSEQLGVPVINLGIGGARPWTFLSDPAIVDVLMRCRAVVVEAMSARSYPSEIFTPMSDHSGLGVTALDSAVMQGIPQFNQRWYFIDQIYAAALKAGADLNRTLIEIRTAYIADMRALAGIVTGKSVFLYLSQRKPDYVAETWSYVALCGGFPHFVDRTMVDLLASEFSEYIEHVSTSGLPNQLVDRETGEAVRVSPGAVNATANVYYPSPEMHDEVAHLLADRLKGWLARSTLVR